jgi:3-oxoacyl-[acyl-carrier protein] reductase
MPAAGQDLQVAGVDPPVEGAAGDTGAAGGFVERDDLGEVVARGGVERVEVDVGEVSSGAMPPRIAIGLVLDLSPGLVCVAHSAPMPHSSGAAKGMSEVRNHHFFSCPYRKVFGSSLLSVRIGSMDLVLAGKRAFITGGTLGIGLGIAHALAEEGASVAVCGRDKDRLETAISGLRASGATAYGVPADVTDTDRLAAAIDESAEALGGLDLLVANAGRSAGGDLLESTPADWIETYALNVLHAAHAVRTAVPHFERAGGGAVLIIASIMGWKPGPKSSYASAKAAEIQLAAALAQELASRNVRVNALSPGSVMFEGGVWDWLRENHPERYARFVHEDLPGGRLVNLREVTATACFLLSEQASGINGANIAVDGAQDHPSARRFFPEEYAGVGT